MSTEFWTILGVGVAVIGLNWCMYEGLPPGHQRHSQGNR